MSKLQVLLVSSEVVPFAKTGGLADVSAALARDLARRGHDTRLVMPMYRRVRESGANFKAVETLQDIPLEISGRMFHFSVSTVELEPGTPEIEGARRADVLFIRCPELFDRDEIYGYEDDSLRFAFLSRAALVLCQWMQWAPDIIHCNDWHTGLIPLYLRVGYAWDGLFERTKTVLTIHNIGYQGVTGDSVLASLDLESHRSLLYQEDLDQGQVNMLKTGILYADALTTVSETYAREIQTDEFGMGLQEVLRARSDALVGIVNGVDYADWDPATDKLIPANYTAKKRKGKAECKARLLERMGLSHDPAIPTFGIVSRLTAQKGFELLPDVLPILLREAPVRLVVLGSGEERYERYFDWLGRTFPEQVAFRNAYDEELAHWIEAGSDVFLMPSRYEPCGLNQMYSLRYGTPPVVRSTGGLADTVSRFDPETGEGSGFVFDDFTADALLSTLRWTLLVWKDQKAWAKMQANGMSQDFSWEKQGAKYEALYRRLLS